MTTNIEVVKTQNETNANLLRRFSRRVQESKILKRARALRFNERPESRLKRKAGALMRIKRNAEREKLKKLGKLLENNKPR